MSSAAIQFPHRRYNPLLRQWILVSPQRTQRPWQGETTKAVTTPGVVRGVTLTPDAVADPAAFCVVTLTS